MALPTEHPRGAAGWRSCAHQLGAPIDPALVGRETERAEPSQNRIADAITRFAGSMLFVYLHIIWFGCWIGFGVEDYPTGC